MRQVLFEVDPANPLFYVAVSGTLLLVAVLPPGFRRDGRPESIPWLRFRWTDCDLGSRFLGFWKLRLSFSDNSS